ncbi:MAG: YgiT-type zinc finger protein [Polyangia bacterium]
MKCVVCRGSNVETRLVEEEIRSGNDILLLPLEVTVCETCGERYYTRSAMKKIEDAREDARRNELKVSEVGRVLRAELG